MKRTIILAILLLGIGIAAKLSLKEVTGSLIKIDDENVVSVLVTVNSRGLITTDIYEMRLENITNYNSDDGTITFKRFFGHIVESYINVEPTYKEVKLVPDSIKRDFDTEMSKE